MANSVDKITFKEGVLKVGTAGETPGTTVDQVAGPIEIEIGMETEEIQVWFERFPIGDNLTTDSFKISTVLADSTATGLALAFPGLSSEEWGDEQNPTLKSVSVTIPFANGDNLIFTAPHAIVKGGGSVSIGRQPHLFPISFEARKAVADTAPVTIEVDTGA